MASFDKAIHVLLAHEGGYVNHPADPAGATNYGVSLRFLKDHLELGDVNGDGVVNVEDIKNLTLDDAKHIYMVEWWDKYKYGQIVDQLTATKIFDFSVNMGASRAHKLLQQALNTTFKMKLTVDGILGPATLGIINSIEQDPAQEQVLIKAYSDTAWAFYQSLIKSNPSLAVFSKGWKNRAYSIMSEASLTP